MSLRDEFEAEVRSAIGKCYDLGYIPSRFEQMIETAHPVEVAKQLVVSGEFQHGIRELTKLGHQETNKTPIIKQRKQLSLNPEMPLLGPIRIDQDRFWLRFIEEKRE